MNFNDQRIIKDYFDKLECWKCLPAYKLETRIDSIVGFALPEIIKDLKGYSVRTVIPELPLRVGTLEKLNEDEKKKKENRSYKVDFYILTECHKNLFIEFKSDSNSRNDKQDRYLEEAIEKGMKKILGGIIDLASVSAYEEKYQYLLGTLHNFGLVTRENGNIHPTPHHSKINRIYIQPKRLKRDREKDIIDYKKLADSISRCYKGSEFMKSFARSIKNWSGD